MPERRYLIVNADDFGLSPGINRGIITAHQHGIVTSTSLMVRSSSAAEAVAMSRDCPQLALGMHLDLCEWVCTDGEWSLRYEVVPLHDVAALRGEVQRQLDAFRALVGRDPTHLDSHQHYHMREPLRTIVTEVAQAIDVPLRQCTPGLGYVGNFYGQTAYGDPEPSAITVGALVTLLMELPTGIHELACHPGDASDADTTYRDERATELWVLCDPAVRDAVDRVGITLCSFAQAGALLRA
jgi:predicted glycoside hydrolase/deacetylase ChbG (UPF0249 family)